MSKYQALYAEKANIGFEAGICTQDLKWQVIQPNIFFFSWNSSSQQSGIIKSIHRCRHLAESSQWRLHCEPKFPKTAPAPFLLPCKAQNILSYKCLSLLLIFFPDFRGELPSYRQQDLHTYVEKKQQLESCSPTAAVEEKPDNRVTSVEEQPDNLRL